MTIIEKHSWRYIKIITKLKVAYLLMKQVKCIHKGGGGKGEEESALVGK